MILFLYFVLKCLILAHECLHFLFDFLDLLLGLEDSLIFKHLLFLLLLVVLVNLGFLEVVLHLLGFDFTEGFGFCFIS